MASSITLARLKDLTCAGLPVVRPIFIMVRQQRCWTRLTSMHPLRSEPPPTGHRRPRRLPEDALVELPVDVYRMDSFTGKQLHRPINLQVKNYRRSFLRIPMKTL